MTAQAITSYYDTDFYNWAICNANLLKKGKLTEIDAANIAEELESMAKRDKRQLINRLIILLLHLLKWEFQPSARSGSWKGSVIEQRRRIRQLLDDSPSLINELELKIVSAYKDALQQASVETNLDQSVFPEQCPYTKEQLFDGTFYPGEQDSVLRK